MSVVVQTSTRAVVELPLACDPAIQRDNPREALRRLRLESDDEGISIPEDAATVKLRPLSADEIRECERRAGRLRYHNQRIYVQTAQAIVDALKRAGVTSEHVEAVQVHAQQGGDDEAARAKVEEMDRRSNEVIADVLDGLSDADAAAREAHMEWVMRRDNELVRLGLLGLSDVPDPAAAGWTSDRDGFPVEHLRRTHLGPAVIDEVADHIRRVSTLDPRRPQSSATSSGQSTTPPNGGTAASACATPSSGSGGATAATPSAET